MIQLPRKYESLIARLRIGHTPLTHMHLFKGEPPPECNFCPGPVELSVEHNLLECAQYSDVRKKYFRIDTMERLFNIVEYIKIIRFVKEIGLLDRL